MKEWDIVGQFYVGEYDRIFFLGLRGDLVRAAIKQAPEAIIEARNLPGVEHTEFTAAPLRLDRWKKANFVQNSWHFTLHPAGWSLGWLLQSRSCSIEH